MRRNCLCLAVGSLTGLTIAAAVFAALCWFGSDTIAGF